MYPSLKPTPKVTCRFWQKQEVLFLIFRHNGSQQWFFGTVGWSMTYGCFLKWWYPKNTPKWSFLVGKPMVVGYHHFRKPPYGGWFVPWLDNILHWSWGDLGWPGMVMRWWGHQWDHLVVLRSDSAGLKRLNLPPWIWTLDPKWFIGGFPAFLNPPCHFPCQCDNHSH